MEVVVGVVVFSQVVLSLSDEYLRRKRASAPPPSSAAAPAPRRSSTSSIPEVRALEAELKKLREKARDANSPDTFVQSAMLNRKANEVEKKLIALRGDQGDQASLPILDLMSSMMPASATASLTSQAKFAVLRAVLGFLPLVFLWSYFRFYTQNEASAVIVADCDIFRPFGFLFRKVPQSCTEDTCDAAEMCAIGYRAVSIVTNAVVGRLISSIKATFA